MEINNLIIDEDLIGYLSSKENINTFINFCIRERQSVEIKMSMKRVRTPSIAELEKRWKSHTNLTHPGKYFRPSKVKIMRPTSPK